MDFEVVQKDGDIEFFARSLVSVDGEYVQIEITKSGVVKSVSRVNQRIAGTHEKYTHARLVNNNGKLDFIDLPYRPRTYPRFEVMCEVYLHTSGKLWAVSGNHDLVFFKNDQTYHRLVCQVIDNSIPKSKRIAEKIGKGYALLGTKKYDLATNSFI